MSYKLTSEQLQAYKEIKETINFAEGSAFKKERLKKEILKTIKKTGKVDYHVFPIAFRWNLCAARLRMGRFDNWDGWDFRSDWSMTFQGYNGHKTKIPKWAGQKVNHLVVLGEQGVGDEILFASALPELIVRLGYEAIEFQCIPRVQRLFERSFKIQCTDRRKFEDINEGDAIVALADLFMFYRRASEHFPRKPYLKLDPQRIDHWKEWLDSLGEKPKIGIAWKARHGSIPVEKMMVEDAIYINLQYLNHPDGKWKEKLPKTVIDPGVDPLTNLEDHMCLIAALDRVVTVTQTVSHECGSIGKECDVIRPTRGTGDVHNSLWYYGTGNIASPVYGSVYVHNTIQDYASSRKRRNRSGNVDRPLICDTNQLS